ncbi:PQQ-binding-like beta-propeller repeat protein [Actinocorallia longicatena]|uniref:Pyrroloquinoline-quinone binding quinoprotein n=1 Tax=Actinocorallia longicatena TaxID=111803 RepID=A0ABP6PYX9_9ACTN
MPPRAVAALTTIALVMPLPAGCSFPPREERPAAGHPRLPGLSRTPAWTIEAAQFGDPGGGGNVAADGLFTVGTAFALAYTATRDFNEIVLLRAATGKVLRRLPVPRGTEVRADRAGRRPVLVAESPRDTVTLDRWILDEEGEVRHTATPLSPPTAYAGGYLFSGAKLDPARRRLADTTTVADESGDTVTEIDRPSSGPGTFDVFGDLAVIDRVRVLDLKRDGRRLTTIRSREGASAASVHGLYAGKLLVSWRIGDRGRSLLTLNDARTGRTAWTRELAGFTALTAREVAYEPTEHRLIVTDRAARLHLALDMETGRTVWKHSGPALFGLALPDVYYLATAAWEPFLPHRAGGRPPYVSVTVPKGAHVRELTAAPAARSSDGYALVRRGGSLYGFPLT